MASGTPVVSTSKGAEGLAVASGRNILIADTPADFAQAIVQILRSSEVREAIGRAGRALVETQYSAVEVGRKLSAVLEQAVERG
jgi:glycosyltransferase involved in cell wall biosynthesis